MNTKFNPVRFVQILTITLAIVALAFGQVSFVAAQSGTSTNITSYDQIPEKGQLIIPAGTGFKAPALMHGLVATITYGGMEDTTASLTSYSNGIAKDRVAKYGGLVSDYPTVIWTGASDTITGTQNCRDGFYSDSVVITKGVVYGDRCPLMIEYHLEHFVSVAPAATEPPAAAAPESANPSSIAPVLPVVPTTSIPGVPEWFWSLIQWLSLGCFVLLFAMLAAYAAYVVIKPRHGSSWALGLAAVAFFISFIPCMWFLVMISLGIYSLTRVKTVTIIPPAE